MMSNNDLEIGDIVRLTTERWENETGIVSQPITKTSPGHVLVYRDGCVLGVSTRMNETIPADKSSEGYVQLAYNLIKLGSHVIEQGLLQNR